MAENRSSLSLRLLKVRFEGQEPMDTTVIAETMGSVMFQNHAQ